MKHFLFPRIESAERNLRISLVFLLGLLFFSTSCKKETTAVGFSDRVVIFIKHKVDTAALEFDTINYFNEAGNNYGVERLNYYLSDLTFLTSDGRHLSANKVYYVDGRDSASQVISIDVPGKGDIVGFTATLGVPEDRNVFGMLPSTMENQNMLWPEFMGGGYHFLKMEGSFVSGNSSYGYAMHIGKNGFQAHLSGSCDFKLRGITQLLEMDMNVNELFKNPYPYNLDVDGNYTMGDSLLMRRISDNAEDMCSIHVKR